MSKSRIKKRSKKNKNLTPDFTAPQGPLYSIEEETKSDIDSENEDTAENLISDEKIARLDEQGEADFSEVFSQNPSPELPAVKISKNPKNSEQERNLDIQAKEEKSDIHAHQPSVKHSKSLSSSFLSSPRRTIRRPPLKEDKNDAREQQRNSIKKPTRLGGGGSGAGE